jgi:hypothetical protein
VELRQVKLCFRFLIRPLAAGPGYCSSRPKEHRRVVPRRSQDCRQILGELWRRLPFRFEPARQVSPQSARERPGHLASSRLNSATPCPSGRQSAQARQSAAVARYLRGRSSGEDYAAPSRDQSLPRMPRAIDSGPRARKAIISSRQRGQEPIQTFGP